MKKELTEKLKKESLSILILFLVIIIMFKILFYKEGFLAVLRAVFALFWVFVLPGFYLMYYWHEQLEFMVRLIIGIAVSSAIIGIASYYLGLLGLNIMYHGIILPAACLIAGFFIIYKEGKEK